VWWCFPPVTRYSSKREKVPRLESAHPTEYVNAQGSPIERIKEDGGRICQHHSGMMPCGSCGEHLRLLRHRCKTKCCSKAYGRNDRAGNVTLIHWRRTMVRDVQNRCCLFNRREQDISRPRTHSNGTRIKYSLMINHKRSLRRISTISNCWICNADCRNALFDVGQLTILRLNHCATNPDQKGGAGRLGGRESPTHVVATSHPCRSHLIWDHYLTDGSSLWRKPCTFKKPHGLSPSASRARDDLLRSLLVRGYCDPLRSTACLRTRRENASGVRFRFWDQAEADPEGYW